MENFYGKKTDNRILRRLFRKAEISYAVSDFFKSIAPIIDLMFISLFIGPNGVTVIGYVSPLIMLLELFGTIFSIGARNKVSSLIGSGDLDGANQTFTTSVIAGASASTLTALAIWLFCSDVTILLGARDTAVFDMTRQYIYGYIIGFPFLTLTRILIPYLQMEGQYLRVNVSALMTTVIDIAADAFVIFVLAGGMLEIGLATSAGYIIPFFICAAFFMQKKKRSLFRLSLKNIRPKYCLDMIRFGLPGGVIKCSNALGGMAVNNMLTAMNVPYLVAAYGVFSQITLFFRSSWYAPSDTLLSFSGVFIGEEDRDSLKKAQSISLRHALLFTGIVTVFLFVLARPLAEIFIKTSDPVTLELCTECIRVSCFILPFHAIVYNFNNYLMAVKKIRFCAFYSFLLECGCLVPSTYLMLRLMNYHGA